MWQKSVKEKETVGSKRDCSKQGRSVFWFVGGGGGPSCCLAGGCGQGEAVDQKTSEKYRTLIPGSLMGLSPIQAIHLSVLSDFILGQRSGPVKQGRETGRSEGRGNCRIYQMGKKKSIFNKDNLGLT